MFRFFFFLHTTENWANIKLHLWVTCVAVGDVRQPSCLKIQVSWDVNAVEVWEEHSAFETMGNCLTNDMVWHTRKLESLSPLLQEPHILQLSGLFV
jgi:hypothetical protein